MNTNKALIVAVASQKGGVAKTTATVTLAHLMALTGHKTLLVDRDTQLNTLLSLGLQPDNNEMPEPDIYETGRENLSLLPAGGNDISLMDLADHFDVIMIDTPPNSFVQQTTLPYADVIIVPASLESFGLNGVRLTLDVIGNVASDAQTWILPTIYNKSGLHKKNLAKLNELYDGDVAPQIFYSGYIPISQEAGKTIYEYTNRYLDDVRYGYGVIGCWIDQAINGKKHMGATCN